MKMRPQQTLKNEVRVTGIGLHSGLPVTLVLHPGLPGTGIRFRRIDLTEKTEILATPQTVVNTQLATTIGIDKKNSVSTIEHLMAAFALLKIDNVLVDVDGAEIPIMDGSAEPFVDAILRAGGTRSQLSTKKALVIKKKIEIKMGEKWAKVEPSDRFEVHGSIEWDHPAIGYQEFRFIDGETAADELSRSRTFCLLKDVEAMRRMGLARGGSLANAVVVDSASVLNPEGLRYTNEFVRHKVLDSIGDFKLAGYEIQGAFRLHRAGHDLHAQILIAIFANPENYEIVDVTDSESEKTFPHFRAALARITAMS